MNATDSEVVLRRPTTKDVDYLYKMVNESTSCSTKICASTLSNILFSDGKLETAESKAMNQSDDQLDIELLASNSPAAQAFLAEVNNELAGYLIFHYHWSPWSGRSAFIDDIFVVPSHRKKGM